MTFNLNTETLRALAESLARSGESVAAAARELERFGREMWATIWEEPVLLRQLPKGRPKSERRRIGRRIRNLERANRCS